MELLLAVVLIPAVTGLAGAFTPCALGINTIVVGTLSGKSHARRVYDWTLFAVTRASVLMALGLVFGLVGQAVGDMARIYQQVINIGMIVLGALFIISRFRRIPIPGVSLVSPSFFQKRNSMISMGLLFGLDVSACIAPLLLALLAQTVLLGDWAAGAISLFIFGIALSIPSLVVTLIDGADRWLQKTALRYNKAFYIGAGSFLIVFGAAEFALTLMS